MNFSPDDFYKVVLAAVALISLIVGPLLQWRIAKRQAADNISAKRQVWIDELRKDASEFLTLMARLEELRRPAKGISPEDARKNFDDMMVANARATELGIRIKLRLNPKEAEHIELVRLLRVLSDVCKDPPADETQVQMATAQADFRKARDNVVGHLQTILKLEWERVKRGSL